MTGGNSPGPAASRHKPANKGRLPMASANYLIGPARGHIRWYPAIGDQPPAGSRADEPGPRPWSAAVSGLAEAANVKRIAASLPESDLQSQLEAGAARSIEDILDEWCGPRRPYPELALGPTNSGDRARRRGRSDSELTPGWLPSRRTAPHRRPGALAALRTAAELTTQPPGTTQQAVPAIRHLAPASRCKWCPNRGPARPGGTRPCMLR